MSEKTYTCADCLGTFEEGWSEEEALAEMKDNNFDPALYPCVKVCDDCYNRMMKAWKQ